jgi:hypothetical protein
MVGKFPIYQCAGYIEAKVLMTDQYITDLGYGPVYAASQSELLDIEELKNEITKRG